MAVAIDHMALEHLALTGQRALHVRHAVCVHLGTQQFGQAGAGQCFGRNAKPSQVSMVGKAVSQRTVPVRHHGGQVVQDGVQIVLGLLERFTQLLGAVQFTHKHSAQAQTRQHQQRGKAAQLPCIAAPAGQNGLRRLGHVEDQRVARDMAEGVEALNAVQRSHAGELALAAALHALHVGRS